MNQPLTPALLAAAALIAMVKDGEREAAREYAAGLTHPEDVILAMAVAWLQANERAVDSIIDTL